MWGGGMGDTPDCLSGDMIGSVCYNEIGQLHHILEVQVLPSQQN